MDLDIWEFSTNVWTDQRAYYDHKHKMCYGQALSNVSVKFAWAMYSGVTCFRSFVPVTAEEIVDVFSHRTASFIACTGK